ncbi:hypothetical protein DERP_001730 [Dermatophagoides pteronyssinus]|uniref:Uncharacterized protein n=1 Tax=Dermatophagoides pteronyssinus TaxID=6956 RepID=A0ABQ8JBC6_DERPT|nr:hypothetical protein DERP_001730 [Dermatophagoides pteronyssinus]
MNNFFILILCKQIKTTFFEFWSLIFIECSNESLMGVSGISIYVVSNNFIATNKFIRVHQVDFNRVFCISNALMNMIT